MKKVFLALALGSAALTGIAATPVLAQDRYGYHDNYDSRDERAPAYDNGGYRQTYDDSRSDERGYDQQRVYDQQRRYEQQQSYGRPVYDRGYQRSYSGARPYRNYQQCQRQSGTTGTILGAIVGGLFGREIGRGGYYNQPSTTGLILGAGAGALAGRAIDKNASCH